MTFIPDNNENKPDRLSQQETSKEETAEQSSESPLDLLKQGRKATDSSQNSPTMPELTLSSNEKPAAGTDPLPAPEKVLPNTGIRETIIPTTEGFLTKRDHYDTDGQLARTDTISDSYSQREYYDTNGNVAYRNIAYANGDKIIEVFQKNQPMCLSIITGSLCQTTYRTGNGHYLCSITDDGTKQIIDYESPGGAPMRHEADLNGYSSVQTLG